MFMLLLKFNLRIYNNQKFSQIVESDKTLKIKSIRYTIVNPGNCPDWHLGAGNPTWLFIDELIFN